MKIRFLDIAQIELNEAIKYFENESPGLGEDFLKEVLKSLDRVGRHPQAWHPYSKRTRRCLLRKFPYGLIYYLKKDEVIVIALACLHRKPEYWQNRIK